MYRYYGAVWCIVAVSMSVSLCNEQGDCQDTELVVVVAIPENVAIHENVEHDDYMEEYEETDFDAELDADIDNNEYEQDDDGEDESPLFD